MGHTAGTLGPVPAAAEEGLAVVEGPTTAMSAAEEPSAGKKGPGRTCGLKE